MAETSTALNGCDLGIHLDKQDGTPVDISGSSNQVNMQFTKQLGEYQVFGSSWVRRLACKRDATMTLQVVYSTAADEALDVLRDWYFNDSDTKRTLRILVPQDEVGADSYSGEFFLASLEIPIDAGEAAAILVTAELKPDGAVTHTTTST